MNSRENNARGVYIRLFTIKVFLVLLYRRWLTPWMVI